MVLFVVSTLVRLTVPVVLKKILVNVPVESIAAAEV